jgi:CBS domain-containing protein
VGQGIAFLFGLVGLFGNPMLLFVALFVFIGAGQEAAAVQMRSAFDGVPVSRAMLREFHVLRRSAPLSEAVDLLLAGSQQDFPVIEDEPGEAAVGILTRSALLAALAGGDTSRRVRDVLQQSCGPAHPLELLEPVFRRMEESGCSSIPVVDDGGRVVGLLTLENVGEMAAIHAALRRGASV